MTDFLIQFGSNATAVIAQMRQLEAQALRTQQVINQTAAASARTASAGVGSGAGALGVSASAVRAVTPEVESLTKSLGALQSQMRALGQLGIQPTLAQTRREMSLLQQITAAGGPTFGRFNSATAATTAGLVALNPAAAASAQQLIAQRAALDGTSDAFQRHAGRISETILLYAAFAAAAAAATSAVSLSTTIDTESRRLEAVLQLTPDQGRDFVKGVFGTAVGTATPVEDLIRESDLVASAFAGVENAADRQRLSLELLNRAGQTTSVTQRDMATETQNLIAIMQLGGLSVEQLGTVLGQVTAAGNNSSTSIAAILDALNIAIPGAKLAGVTIEQLIALTGLFRQETQRSGSEIGNTFKTLFQTITQPEAENNISDLTGGLVELRDEAGNLRPALEILLQIRSLIDSGAIDPGKLNDIFKAFAPPLNPGAAKDIAIIFDLLDQLPTALREVETTGAAALDGLVEKLNAALGPQFIILIEQIKAGFVDLFQEDIIGAGQTLIDLMRSLGDILGAIPPDVLRVTVGMLALLAAFKGIAFIGGSMLALLGIGGITGALTSASAAAVAAGRSFGFMSAVGLGFLVTLSKILPLLAAFMAIDFAQQVGAQQDALRGQIGGSFEGLDEAGLREARARLEAQKGPEFLENGNLFDLRSVTTDPVLNEGIAEIDRLLASLKERGADATVTLEDLSEGFTGAGNASQEVTDIIASQTEEMERLIAQYGAGAEAAAGMTEAQRIEAEAATLLNATRKGQAADLEKLAERFREGKISAEEFAQGQQIVAQAAELAAQLVATVGTRLGEYPLFAEAAAEGNEALTARVYEMIVASGGSINAIAGLIQQLGNLGAANAAIAGSLAANPLVIRLAVQKFDSTTLGNNPELLKAQRFAQTVTGQNAAAAAAADAQIKAILDSINNLVGGFGGGTSSFGNVPSFGGGGTSPKAPRAPRDPTIFDLDDFPPSMLAQAIALATRLQNQIPGAKAAAKDEILSIISNAQFLRQVKGLDDQLLRKAIEELTDIEKERLEEEKRKNAANEILTNVQVNAGTLGALISQPTVFGIGGSIPGGLNYNPNGGTPFVINVDFSKFGSLTDKQLQQKIYQTITEAIKNGLRLQGNG